MEIGWNIPTTVKTNSIKFTVSFTMHDVATKWKDVATFQWEPFGENNQVPIWYGHRHGAFPQRCDREQLVDLAAH